MRNKRCPRCSSTDIIPNTEIADCAAGNAPRRTVSFASNSAPPKGNLLCKVAKSSEIRAWICLHCGFTEVYTLGIRELSADYRRS